MKGDKTRYIVTISDRMVGYTKKKKIAVKFIHGYCKSNSDKKEVIRIVKGVKGKEKFLDDPENEIIYIARILLPRRYEVPYFAYFYGSEIQQLILETEMILSTKVNMSKAERRFILSALDSLYAASIEDDLYVPSISNLDSAKDTIDEYRDALYAY